MSELKPCPFCGDRYRAQVRPDGVQCGNCGAVGPVFYSRADDPVGCWNTRAADQPPDVLQLMTDRADELTRKVREFERAFAKVHRLERQLAAKGDEQNRALALEIVQHVMQAERPSTAHQPSAVRCTFCSDTGLIDDKETCEACGGHSAAAPTPAQPTDVPSDIAAVIREIRRISKSGTEIGDRVLELWGLGPEHRFNVFARAHGKGGSLEEYVARALATGREPEDNMTDVEADADTLKSAGWGTDEDYGYFGGDYE